MEAHIFCTLSNSLKYEENLKYVISPYTRLSILESKIIIKDSLGNIQDYHFITDVYTIFTQFNDSLDFIDIKNNFVLSNKDSLYLPKFVNQILVDTLSIKNFKNIFKTPDLLTNQWAFFYDTYPRANGYLIISRPGISSDKQWAIIFYEIHRNSLDGSGNFVLLKRIGDEWKIVESINQWVS